MAQVIIRIELRGTPGGAVYQTLHQVMEGKGWRRTISGTAGTTPLPSAMYQGNYDGTPTDLSTAIHDQIVPSVWLGGSAVLVVQVANWAQHGWWYPEQ
jgi:hypothetical protein